MLPPLQALVLVIALASIAQGCHCTSKEFDLDPDAIRFARAKAGTHSVEALVVRNVTDRPITIAVRIDTEPSAFDATFSTCAESLPTREQCAIFVGFNPAKAGSYEERLCVWANGSETCVPLRGAATPERRQL